MNHFGRHSDIHVRMRQLPRYRKWNAVEALSSVSQRCTRPINLMSEIGKLEKPSQYLDLNCDAPKTLGLVSLWIAEWSTISVGFRADRSQKWTMKSKSDVPRYSCSG